MGTPQHLNNKKNHGLSNNSTYDDTENDEVFWRI